MPFNNKLPKEQIFDIENAVAYLGNHVKQFIYDHPDEFRMVNWDTDIPGYRLTLTLTKGG